MKNTNIYNRYLSIKPISLYFTCITSTNTLGNISSISPISFEKRLRIRPNIKKLKLKFKKKKKLKKTFFYPMDFYLKNSLLIL